jgi:adenylosuccinate synthase
MINVTEAIKAINSNAKYKIVGSDIDTCEIEWIDTTAISKSDIKAKMAELKTAYDNNKYQRDRAAEYPSIEDQLDDIYHNGVDGWKTTIKAVKDKYPKE